MKPFFRKVHTASGKTAVQIADKSRASYEIVKDLGSAGNEAELAVLGQNVLAFLNPDQGVFDSDAIDTPRVTRAVVKLQRSSS